MVAVAAVDSGAPSTSGLGWPIETVVVVGVDSAIR